MWGMFNRANRSRRRDVGPPAAARTDELVASYLVAEHREQLHEVRASLAGVASVAWLLARPAAALSDDDRVRFAGMLDAELGRLDRLLGGPEIETARSHSLDDLIEPVIAARQLAGQPICWKKSGAQVWCTGDPVAEAVNILLVNADKHAPGAQVTVETELSAKQVRILVADDGPGIPMGLRGSVFAAGVRGVDSTGQGIGLDLARRLIRSQGGTLRLDETPTHGAAFDLILPVTSHEVNV